MGASVSVSPAFRRSSDSLIQRREAGRDGAALRRRRRKSRKQLALNNVDVYRDEELGFHSDWHL